MAHPDPERHGNTIAVCIRAFILHSSLYRTVLQWRHGNTFEYSSLASTQVTVEVQTNFNNLIYKTNILALTRYNTQCYIPTQLQLHSQTRLLSSTDWKWISHCSELLQVSHRSPIHSPCFHNCVTTISHFVTLIILNNSSQLQVHCRYTRLCVGLSLRFIGRGVPVYI